MPPSQAGCTPPSKRIGGPQVFSMLLLSTPASDTTEPVAPRGTLVPRTNIHQKRNCTTAQTTLLPTELTVPLAPLSTSKIVANSDQWGNLSSTRWSNPAESQNKATAPSTTKPEHSPHQTPARPLSSSSSPQRILILQAPAQKSNPPGLMSLYKFMDLNDFQVDSVHQKNSFSSPGGSNPPSPPPASCFPNVALISVLCRLGLPDGKDGMVITDVCNKMLKYLVS